MKSKAAILWFGVSVALAIALVMQWNAGKARQLKMEKLQLQVEQNASKPDAEEQVKELEKERMKLLGELRAAEHEVRTLQMAAAGMQATNRAASAVASTSSNGTVPGGEGRGAMGKMLENMMKDPEMRKALEQQQRMGLDMVYGALFKQLNLTPEQEEKFKDLLMAQQMEGMSQASSIFEGTAEDRMKMAAELGEKQKANEQKLKELIGDDKFAQYQDYNQTIGERMMLDQFGRSADVSPEQNEQLLAIFAEEKRNVQINTGTPPMDPTQGWQAVAGQDGAAERFFAQQEEVNQRVLERAAQVLTPEQLRKFEPVMRNQLEMQRAGMKMAQGMFGGQKDAEQEVPAQ